MRFLGIDPGLNLTGYGIIATDNNRLQCIRAGYINTSPRKPLIARLLTIYEGVTGILKEFSIDAVILEKLYAHYKHPVTACLLGHARGAICLACAQSGIAFFEYAPTRVKKSILGKGHASKLQIQHMVEQVLGVRLKNDVPFDVTDALALAMAHFYIITKKITVS